MSLGFANSLTPTIEIQSTYKLDKLEVKRSASESSLDIHRISMQNARSNSMDIITNRVSSNLKLTYSDYIGESNTLILSKYSL